MLYIARLVTYNTLSRINWPEFFGTDHGIRTHQALPANPGGSFTGTSIVRGDCTIQVSILHVDLTNFEVFKRISIAAQHLQNSQCLPSASHELPITLYPAQSRPPLYDECD